mmetsp:Transcript_2609/g.6255  ORF Transcript_2609/g.6255 Transcript_2609/m.6255 type:complete len:598 (+) Transcript_2609:119-1912(+)
MKIIVPLLVLSAVWENITIDSTNNIGNCESCSGVVLANAFEHRHSISLRINHGGISRWHRMISKTLPPVLSSLFSSIGDDEILSMDATTLSKAIQKERSVTCEQLMNATLNLIDTTNPTVNAIILLRDKESLLNEARSCDKVLNEILDTDDSMEKKNIGWLYGIPVAIKDVSNVKNLPTTMGGSPLFCQTGEKLPLATVSDPYVENMIEEGAIVIGKTNSPEGGLGSNTFNAMWGKTLNPFAESTLDISAGGSSGGAAVAVATKMLALADGTDNMGSLRNPAGWNNIYSLRPTAGLIPTVQKDESSVASIIPHPASTPGPMARTPKDCAFLLQSMVRDTNQFDAESLWKKEDSKDMIRIGWLGDWKGRIPMEDGILATCEKALKDWSAASSNRIILEQLESRPLFDFDKLWEGYNAIRFASTLEMYSQMFDLDNLLTKIGSDRLMKEELAWELEQGRAIDQKALDKARDAYYEYEEWLRGMFLDTSDNSKENAFDFLALPSAQVWPFPIEDRYPRVINGTKMETYHRWMEVCVPVSFGGLPCVTTPAGFGKNHASTALPPLPIGIQLFGKKGDDGKLLRLANEYYHYRCHATKQTDA